MLPEKRKKVTIAFLGIYLLFGIILIYLLVFNAGLNIKEEIIQGTSRKEVFLTNETQRIIKNASVYFEHNNERVEILSVKELAPGEKIPINYDFPKELSQIELYAQAPFYATIKKPVLLQFGGSGLSYRIYSPAEIIKNAKFNMSFEVCNDNNVSKEVLVEQTHNEEFLENGFITQNLSLAPDECQRVNYYFIARKTGETTIYFNVKADDITDKEQATIMVKE
jgi:hypothetical protein